MLSSKNQESRFFFRVTAPPLGLGHPLSARATLLRADSVGPEPPRSGVAALGPVPQSRSFGGTLRRSWSPPQRFDNSALPARQALGDSTRPSRRPSQAPQPAR